MDVTLTIPDDLVERLGANDLPRHALEALAAEAYRTGRLTRPDLQRLLGLQTHAKLASFLKAHGIRAALPKVPSEGQAQVQESETVVDRFRAFRAGKTLGGISPAVLIRQGRR